MIDHVLIPLIYSRKHAQHQPPVEYFHHRLLPYAETPERSAQIFNHLSRTGLVDPVEVSKPIAASALHAVHTEDMVRWLEQTSQRVARSFEHNPAYYQVDDPQSAYLYPSVFGIRPAMRRLRDSSPFGHYAFDVFAPVGHGTWDAALQSATVAITGAEQLATPAPLVYALCRPPGHHAGRDFMGGYCYLNNAAIAANHLSARGNIAIVDLDYHHGNGTQDIFWDNPRVFWGSIHADPSREYPYYAGYADETGGENAPLTNLNLPLPSGTQGPAYLTALDRLLDAAQQFAPVALVVSIGFDTFIDDPLCSFQLTPQDYRNIGAAIAQLRLPTLLVQEGGYNVSANGALAEQLLRGLLNIP